MPYMLIFKCYLGTELKSEEWHYFSNLEDLYNYAAARLNFVGTESLYDRYELEVKLA